MVESRAQPCIPIHFSAQPILRNAATCGDSIFNFSIDALPAIWTHAVRFDDNRVERLLPFRRYVLLAQTAPLDELLKRSNIES